MAPNTADDAALVQATIVALREERRRAPGDLLALLALLLVAASVVLLAVGLAIGEGPARDVLLNLTGEVLGTALTVVLIGGLWRRFESSSEGALERLVGSMATRQAGPLSDEERAAFGAIVELHQRTAAMSFVPRMVTGFVYALQNRGRLRGLEDMLAK